LAESEPPRTEGASDDESGPSTTAGTSTEAPSGDVTDVDGAEDGAVDVSEDGAEFTSPRAPERAPRREPADELSEEPEPDDSDDSDDDPVDPSEPRRSANATGIDTTAAPTPRATANAPTRPTYRAHTDPEASGLTRRNSIGRASRRPPPPDTRPTDEDDDDGSADMKYPSRTLMGSSPSSKRSRRQANARTDLRPNALRLGT
jgi:hypothetical protein